MSINYGMQQDVSHLCNVVREYLSTSPQSVNILEILSRWTASLDRGDINCEQGTDGNPDHHGAEQMPITEAPLASRGTEVFE